MDQLSTKIFIHNMEKHLQPQSCRRTEISDEAAWNTTMMTFTGLLTFKLLAALQFNKEQ